jgi:hypothetical protein
MVFAIVCLRIKVSPPLAFSLWLSAFNSLEQSVAAEGVSPFSTA